MPIINLQLSDEEIERIASRVVEKLAGANPKPVKPQNIEVDRRLQINGKEAAYRLGVSVATLSRLVKRGLIHPNRANGRPMYPVKELERFIVECSRSISV